MTDDPKQGEPEKQSPVQPDQDDQSEESDGGRKPPPDDLSKDPAYNPEGPLKGIKGG